MVEECLETEPKHCAYESVCITAGAEYLSYLNQHQYQGFETRSQWYFFQKANLLIL